MEDLKNYLLNPEKDFRRGVQLLKKYAHNDRNISMLEKSNGEKMYFNILLNKLNNIHRISMQRRHEDKPVVSNPIKIDNKPIIVQKKHFSEVEVELEESKLLTNKLLARKWDELDLKEQKYFKENKEIFLKKKELLIENSRIESDLKTLHAKLHLAPDDETRQSLAEKMVELKKQQADNWEVIDDKNYEPKPEVTGKFTDPTAQLILKRNNLRSRITKLKKQVLDVNSPKYKKKLEQLNEAEKELAEINNSL